MFATPVAYGTLLVIADWRMITPNRLTALSLATSLAAAVLIAIGGTLNFAAAALAIQVAYVLDCMDGQLARYRGSSSRSGAFADKWSDHIKFPAILLGLTIAAFQRDPSLGTACWGFAAVFSVGYRPYLGALAASELGLAASPLFSRPDFVSRNLRFFLFEEAQWYMAVSLCLALQSAYAALVVIATTQSATALVSTLRVFVFLRRDRRASSQE